MPPEHALFDTQELLEKPLDKTDNLRMLLDMNGGICEVVTGVTVGAFHNTPMPYTDDAQADPLCAPAVYPVLEAPGYKIKYVPPDVRSSLTSS